MPTTADLPKAARTELVGLLKANAGVVALIPALRLYGPEPPATPVWPWGYVASPIEGPFVAACMDGSSLSVTVHGFAKGPGDDAASAIGNAFKRALNGREIVLDTAQAIVEWQQTQTIRDSAEAGSYHVICRFNVDISA